MSRDDLLTGKVQLRPGAHWRTCLFRDNGDGTALVIVGQSNRDKPVTVGTKTYSGTFHTVQMDRVVPTMQKGTAK